MLPDKLAFVDIETTGTSASRGRIIEIGIVRVENNEITKTFNTLINPQTHLPPEIEMLTGITIQDLEGKPVFRDVADDILEMIDGCIFVAHNVRFDYSFLKYEYMRENKTFSAKHFCTVKLSRLLFPQHTHHNLDAIIERFGFTCDQRHRAFHDAEILWKFYQKAQEIFPQETVIEAVNQALRRPTTPIKLNQDDLDNLPELPGVYIFYGTNQLSVDNSQLSENSLSVTGQSAKQTGVLKTEKPEAENRKKKTDTPAHKPDNPSTSLRVDQKTIQPENQTLPIYIGKSKNIRDRVLSHFSGDIRSPKEMKLAQQVQSIETIVTAGELGALFLEAKLVKKLLPLYNRLLRIKHELVALRRVIDKHGYETVQMETVQTIDPHILESYIGLFKSRKQAKTFLTHIADEFGLCEKLLGIEKTTTACFGYRLNRCKGACIKKEKPLFYNLRFTTACLKTKIKPWPFKGPIMISEKKRNQRNYRTFCCR